MDQVGEINWSKVEHSNHYGPKQKVLHCERVCKFVVMERMHQIPCGRLPMDCVYGASS
jgi:hypothetical protein